MLIAVGLLALASPVAAAASGPVPTLPVGALTANIVIDGRLDAAAWASADASDDLTQVDPLEGAVPSARTRVRVLAGAKAIVIGVECDQPPGTPIVSYSVRRDALLTSEDHVLLVLDPFLDGRSGYVFAVNRNGARYDGLVNPGCDSDNPRMGRHLGGGDAEDR